MGRDGIRAWILLVGAAAESPTQTRPRKKQAIKARVPRFVTTRPPATLGLTDDKNRPRTRPGELLASLDACLREVTLRLPWPQSYLAGTLRDDGRRAEGTGRMQAAEHASYVRHVSGKCLGLPICYVAHGVNREFHYWRDAIQHLAPPQI